MSGHGTVHWSSQDRARNSLEPVRSENCINFTAGMSGRSREKPLLPVVLFELTLSSGEVDKLRISVGFS